MITEWIDEAAASRGGASYLEDAAGAGSLTFAGLRRATAGWARFLDRAGVAPGAAVALRLPDPVGYAAALVGIVGAGRVVVPLDPAAPGSELSRMLAAARPQAIACDLPVRDLPAGVTVLRPAGALAEGTERAAVPSGTGGIFLCTSGTTGTPKGILLRDGQLSHVAACVAAHHRLSPADRGYCCLPLFHINAEVVGLLATLAARACLVLDRKFSRRGFWPLIEEKRITWINAVPAIIAVLAMDRFEAERPGGHVRFIRSASAPLAPSTLKRFERTFGIPVVETYGMTEAASMITANPLDGPRKPGSVGLPAGAEVRVVPVPAVGGTAPVPAAGGMAPVLAAAGGMTPVLAAARGMAPVPAAAGAVGRVQIRGRGVITEYAAGGPAGAIDPEGWLDTGDLGRFDEDGYLFLAGRSDDVINRGGEKIYPREIEEFLLALEGVSSAAVVAANDEVLGERPVAYVAPAGSWSPDKLEYLLREACEAGLPRAKRPSAFFMVEEMPLGPTGKIARRRLRELAAAPGGGEG